MADVARGGGAQFVDARRRRIAVFAGANRGDRSVLNVHGRGEVRLADAERNDVASLTLQRVDLGQYDECILGAKRVTAVADGRHQSRQVIAWRVHRPLPRRA